MMAVGRATATSFNTEKTRGPATRLVILGCYTVPCPKLADWEKKTGKIYQPRHSVAGVTRNLSEATGTGDR